MASINASCDEADCLLFTSVDNVVPLCSLDIIPSILSLRRTVRYSVIVLPNGFGAIIGGTEGGDGCCFDIGEVSVMIRLPSLSTLT